MKELFEMNLGIKFDRAVEEEDYIRPGEYKIMTQDHKEIEFDFEDFATSDSTEDPTVRYFNLSFLNTDEYPESEHITPEMIIESDFTAFFVYAPEENPIHPVKVESLTMIFAEDTGSDVDFSTISLSEEKLEQINSVIQ